jgi:hypothetical protein
MKYLVLVAFAYIIYFCLSKSIEWEEQQMNFAKHILIRIILQNNVVQYKKIRRYSTLSYVKDSSESLQFLFKVSLFISVEHKTSKFDVYKHLPFYLWHILMII